MQANKDKNFKAICGRIRTRAVALGLSNFELARRSGVSYRTIYSIMQGTARLRDRMIGSLAGGLDVPVEWLMSGKGEPPSAPTGEKGGALVYEAPKGMPMFLAERGSVKSGSRPLANVAEAIGYVAGQLGLDERELAECIMRHWREKLGVEGVSADESKA